jgi:hypothetical protein
MKGHLDCLRFLFGKVKPSRETEKVAAQQATCGGNMNILKYLVEERKISDAVKESCLVQAAMYGRLDCLKYIVEEAKAPPDYWRYIAYARYFEHTDCENYLLEKECPEPTDEQYAVFIEENERLKTQTERLRTQIDRNTWRETSSDAARARKF